MHISSPKLNNGIECLAIYDADCPSVTTTILVKKGSRYENAEQSGLLHLIEHMIFKGTKKRPSSKIIAYDVELLGGMMNAFTSYEYTGFYLKAPKDNFIKVAEILADFFQNSIFNKGELIKEKRVILEEIKMYEDLPMAKIEQVFLEKLFINHPLGRNIAGSKKTLLSMSSNDCLDYIRQNYCKENLLIVIAGNFNQVEMIKVLNDEFGKVKAVINDSTFIPAKKFTLFKKRVKIQKTLEQTHVVMGGFLEAREAKTRIPLILGSCILSGGFGSKFFQKIREDLGLVYYINLDVNQFEDIGYYSINFGLNQKKVEKAIENIKLEIEKFLKYEVSEQEFERAKNFWSGHLIANIETSQELANWYGIKYLLDKEIIVPEKFISDIKKTKLETVIDEWKKYLIPENMMIVTMGDKN